MWQHMRFLTCSVKIGHRPRCVKTPPRLIPRCSLIVLILFTIIFHFPINSDMEQSSNDLYEAPGELKQLAKRAMFAIASG